MQDNTENDNIPDIAAAVYICEKNALSNAERTSTSAACNVGEDCAAGVISITTDNIDPFIRFAGFRTISPLDTHFRRKSYDCRMLYIYKGRGILSIFNESYTLTKGNMYIWKPGIEYDITPDKDSSLVMIVINFDYTNSHCEIINPISPEAIAIFNAKLIHEYCVFTDNDSMNRFIHMHNMQDEEITLSKIVTSYQFRRTNYRLEIRSLMLPMIYKIIKIVSHDKKSVDFSLKVETIIEYIHKNYNKPLSNRAISKLFNFNPEYLNRLIKKYTGFPLHRYLIYYRIQKSLELLHTTDKPIYEIADCLGFKYYNTFSACFKKYIGICPDKYLKTSNI